MSWGFAVPVWVSATFFPPSIPGVSLGPFCSACTCVFWEGVVIEKCQPEGSGASWVTVYGVLLWLWKRNLSIFSQFREIAAFVTGLVWICLLHSEPLVLTAESRVRSCSVGMVKLHSHTHQNLTNRRCKAQWGWSTVGWGFGGSHVWGSLCSWPSLHSRAPSQDRHHARALAALLRGTALLLLQDEVQQALCQSRRQGFPFNLLKEER